MNHILFVITNFRHGGTNKSLENLLSLLDTKVNKVDIFALEHFGPYSSILPNCKILPKNAFLNALITQFKDSSGYNKFISLIVKLLGRFLSLIKFNFTDALYKAGVRRLSKNKSYDTIVAYSEGAPTAFVKHFKSKNKIAWIHCDYSSYLQLNNNPDETQLYESYRHIVCVSEYTKASFCNLIPSVCNKVHAIHNIVDSETVIEGSKKTTIEMGLFNNSFNILSIGRIDTIKRFYKIPQIVRSLIDRKCKFNWYLIGPEGQPDEQRALTENIEKYDVDSAFFWLGEKDNPYPYIKKSNLIVILSISEACPYVVNEAKVLGTPVVCTNFDSAHEFINSEVNGIISPMEEITDSIEMMIKDQKKYKEIQTNLKNFTYDNSRSLSEIDKILQFQNV